MKKLLAIILAVTMLLPVFAVNSFAASYDFSLDTFGSSGWDSSYDKSSKTITFNNAWTGRGWWIGDDGIALTDIESITINFAENTIGCQVVVDYANTDDDQTFACAAGTTSVTATFTEDPVSQVFIQCRDDAGKIVLDSISVTPRTPAAEEPDDDVEVVYTNDSGLPSTDCDVNDPWDFVNIVGNLWGRENVVNCTVEKFSEKLAEGADFVMVVSGNTSSTANVVINGVFDAGNAVLTSTDLGDGKYELSVSLADVKAYMDANSITTFDTVCVQTMFNNFKLHEVKFVTPAPQTPSTYVKFTGFRGYIYVNEQYHAMFIGKHFIALEHIDNGTGVCPLCHAELAEADPNAEKIVYSVEKTQGQDSEGAELASGVPCIDAQGAENYFRVATNWLGGGAVWNDLASAIKTEGTIMRVTYTGTITAMVYQTEAGSYEVIEGFEVADTEDGKKVLTISCADIAAAAPVALSGDFGGWGNFMINYDGDTTLYGIEVVVPGAGGAAAAEDDIVVVE
ncbi:MAG TPA: hypothetical protein IAD28_04740 [Candidatus Faeciplasma avium]|uniref:Uncharacterized protein n=1 Tax=Candidatus Faeciplasma avium TaxID=2840798 RepID=A0A9D1T4R0_9FIRM|nr:hypothetical protein [Candidatus Faeciplasma avium]